MLRRSKRNRGAPFMEMSSTGIRSVVLWLRPGSVSRCCCNSVQPLSLLPPAGLCGMLALGGQTWPDAMLGSGHSYATLVWSDKPQPFHCEPVMLLNGKSCLLDGRQGIPAWTCQHHISRMRVAPSSPVEYWFHLTPETRHTCSSGNHLQAPAVEG